MTFLQLGFYSLVAEYKSICTTKNQSKIRFFAIYQVRLVVKCPHMQPKNVRMSFCCEEAVKSASRLQSHFYTKGHWKTLLRRCVGNISEFCSSSNGSTELSKIAQFPSHHGACKWRKFAQSSSDERSARNVVFTLHVS